MQHDFFANKRISTYRLVFDFVHLFFRLLDGHSGLGRFAKSQQSAVRWRYLIWRFNDARIRLIFAQVAQVYRLLHDGQVLVRIDLVHLSAKNLHIDHFRLQI